MDNEDDFDNIIPQKYQNLKNNQRQSHSSNARLGTAFQQNTQLKNMAAFFDQKAGLNHNKTSDTNIELMEERQKIFEEEIIKRVKEIQKYAKTLHLSIKKIQTANVKRAEETKEMKDSLFKLKEDQSKLESQSKQPLLTEQIVLDILQHKLAEQEEKFYQDLQALESRLSKQTDQAVNRQAKQTQYEMQTILEAMKEELSQSITLDITTQLRQEFQKSISDKVKEQSKLTDKQIQDAQEKLSTISFELEDVKSNISASTKDMNLKIEKQNRALQQVREQMEEDIQKINEQTTEQIETMRKRILKEIKQEYDFKQYASQTDLNDAIQQFNSRIAILNENLSQKAQALPTSVIDNETINQVNLELNKLNKKQKGQDDHLQNLSSDLEEIQRVQNSDRNALSQIQNQLHQLKTQNIDLLNERMQNLSALIDQTQIDVQDQSKSVNMIQQDLKKTQQNQDQLQTKLNEVNYHLEDLKRNQLQKQGSQDMESVAADLKNYVSGQVAGLKLQIEETSSSLREENSSQLNEIQYQIEQVDQKNDELGSKIEDIASQFIKLESKHRELQTQVSSLEISEQKSQNDVQAPAFSMQLVEDQLTEKILSETDSEFKKLKSDIKSLRESQIQFQSSISDRLDLTDKEVNQALDQHSALLSQLQVKHQTLDKNMQTQIALSQEMNSLKDEIPKIYEKLDEHEYQFQQISNQDEIELIQQSLQDHQSKILELSQSINDYEESSETQKQQLSSQIEIFKDQLESMNQEFEQIKQNQHISHDNSQLHSGNFEDSIINSLKETIKLISKDLTSKLDTSIHSQSVLESQQQMSDILMRQQSLEQKQIAVLDSISALESQVHNTDAKFTNMIDEIYENQQSIQEETKNQLEQVEEKQTQQQHHSQNISTQIDRLQDQINGLANLKQSNHDDVKSLQRSDNEEIEEIKMDLSNLQQQLQSLEERNAQLETAIHNQLNLQDNQSSSKIQSLHLQITQHIDDNKANLESQLQNLKKDINEDFRGFKERVHDIIDEKDSKPLIEMLNQKIQEQDHTVNSKIQIMQNNLNKAQESFHEINASTNQTSINLNTLQKEVVQLKNDLFKQCEDCEGKHSKYSIDIDRLNQNYNELQEQLVEMKQELQLLQKNHVPNVAPQTHLNLMQIPANLDMSNINSCRSPQNFLGSASKAQEQQFNETSQLKKQDFEGHNFLEDLSEADLSNKSPNQYGNQTSEGDIMMFNNNTQSLGASAIMSNRLLSHQALQNQSQIPQSQFATRQPNEEDHNKQQSEDETDQQVDFNKQVSQRLQAQQQNLLDLEEHSPEQFNELEEDYRTQIHAQYQEQDNQQVNEEQIDEEFEQNDQSHDKYQQDYSDEYSQSNQSHQEQPLLLLDSASNIPSNQKVQQISQLPDLMGEHSEDMNSNNYHSNSQGSDQNQQLRERSFVQMQEMEEEEDNYENEEFVEEVEETYQPIFKQPQPLTQAAKKPDSSVYNQSRQASKYQEYKDSDEEQVDEDNQYGNSDNEENNERSLIEDQVQSSVNQSKISAKQELPQQRNLLDFDPFEQEYDSQEIEEPVNEQNLNEVQQMQEQVSDQFDPRKLMLNQNSSEGNEEQTEAARNYQSQFNELQDYENEDVQELQNDYNQLEEEQNQQSNLQDEDPEQLFAQEYPDLFEPSQQQIVEQQVDLINQDEQQPKLGEMVRSGTEQFLQEQDFQSNEDEYEDDDFNQEEEVEESNQYEDSNFIDPTYSQNSQSMYQQPGLNQSNQILDYGKEQQDEDEEEEIVLTPEEASEAVADLIFVDELEEVLQEIMYLKNRQFS